MKWPPAVSTTRSSRSATSKVKLAEGDLDLQQFLSAVATGNPPDLVYANRDQIGSLRRARGDHPAWIAASRARASGPEIFVPAALDQVTLDGDGVRHPGVQHDSADDGQRATCCRRPGLTIDDVERLELGCCQRGQQGAAPGAAAAAVQVIGYDSKLPEFLPLWAKANGADLISEDGRTAQLDNPEVVEALDLGSVDLRRPGRVPRSQGVSRLRRLLRRGQPVRRRDSSARCRWSSGTSTCSTTCRPTRPWPSTPCATAREQTLAFAAGSAWAIPSGSDNPEAACRLARAMTSIDAWQAAAEARITARDEEGKPFTGILTGNADGRRD